MSKLGEAIEGILLENEVRILIFSEEDATVSIEITDLNNKDLAVGSCDWNADENLEDVLLQVLDRV